MDIKAILSEIKAELPQTTQLIAVSKFHPAEAIKEAYDAGQRIFGESKVQELEEKHTILPKDIEWHFIGHLQTNKVKYIAPYISMIHAVDSYKLKFGFTPEECTEMLKDGSWKELKNVCISGIMGMATNTDDDAMIESEFTKLAAYFNELKSTVFKDCDSFRELSMGMSDDYHLAIKHGSTLVRIGSKIFGIRNY